MISDARASAALERVDALHTGLTQIVLEGGDLGQIAAEVARVLDVGVLVTSTDGRERAAAVDDAGRSRLEEADLVDPTGRIRVERVDTAGLGVGQGEVRVLRIVAGGADLGRLVCFRGRGAVDSADVHAMERAATVAALVITREAAVGAVEGKYRGDFLRDLLMGRAGDPAYVTEHLESFGWDLHRSMVVVTAELDPPAPDEAPVSSRLRRAWQERFALAWRQVTAAVDPAAPSVDFSSEVVTLAPVGPDDRADPEAPGGQQVVERLVAAVAGDRGGGRRPFSVGVSRVVTGLEGLPDAYGQARRAVEVGRRIHGGASTAYFDRLGLHRLIALVPDPAELRAFAEDVLGDLAGDDPTTADLRETLQVLLDTNFNVAEAARLQFFHYNTMRYRVGKLQRMLGPLASDPHLRLDVAVALRVLEVVR